MENLYKFMFEKDGTCTVRCCPVSFETEDTVFFEELSGRVYRKKSMALERFGAVQNAGKYKTVYLDKFDPDRARYIMVNYYADCIQELHRRIEELNVTLFKTMRANETPEGE